VRLVASAGTTIDTPLPEDDAPKAPPAEDTDAEGVPSVHPNIPVL